jgi:outer membrane protein assembly factor BamB
VGSLHTTIYCAALTGAIVLGTSTRAVAALADLAQSGPLFESRWKLTLPDSPSAPAAYDAMRAYIPLRDGTLMAIELTDGRTLWTVDSPTVLRPATGDVLLFIAGERQIRALNVADGRERWRAALDDAANVAPLFDTGWLFVGTANGHLVAFRASDGELLWKLDMGAPLSALPAPSGESIYLPLRDGRLMAADLQTGQALWTRKLAGVPAEILALDDRLFVGSDDNYFYCISVKDGGIKWRWRTGGDIVAPAVVDEARVYFMSLDNVLRALDLYNGAQRWQRPLANRTMGGPLRSGSLIVVATLAPQLQAYQRTDGKPAGASPVPEGDELSSTLAAPPQRVSVDGRDAFVMLTRQGVIQFFGMPTS